MKVFLTALALLAPLASSAQIGPPDLLQPEDGGWRFVDDVQVWSEVPGAVAYRAQIDTLGGDFSDALADTVIAETAWQVRVWMGFYVWRVAAFDGAAWSDWSEVWTFESRFPVANEPGASPSRGVAIEGVSPNPSGGAATVALDLPEAGEVEAALYDVLGRRVATLASGRFPAGRHEIALDAAGLPAGVYVVRVAAGGVVQTRRVTLVH